MNTYVYYTYHNILNVTSDLDIVLCEEEVQKLKELIKNAGYSSNVLKILMELIDTVHSEGVSHET